MSKMHHLEYPDCAKDNYKKHELCFALDGEFLSMLSCDVVVAVVVGTPPAADGGV